MSVVIGKYRKAPLNAQDAEHQSINPRELGVIAELEKPENAKWLALLIDTEGALGWILRTIRMDRIDERYRYVYERVTPYIAVGMDEIESKCTIDEGARLLGVESYTTIHPTTRKKERRFAVVAGKALSGMRYMKPHFDKFHRMVNLCLTLFKHGLYLPRDKFMMVIVTLFGRYVRSKVAIEMLLRMTEEEFESFVKKAEELTDRYLRGT